MCICLGVQFSQSSPFLPSIFSIFRCYSSFVIHYPIMLSSLFSPFLRFLLCAHILYTATTTILYTQQFNSGQWFALFPLPSRSPLPHRCFLCVFTYHTLLKLFKKLSLSRPFSHFLHTFLFFLFCNLSLSLTLYRIQCIPLSQSSNFLTLLQIITFKPFSASLLILSFFSFLLLY